LMISIGGPLLAGVAGSFFTASSIDTWYRTLEKPWFNPPDWVFGPVWTTLYILMGIALYIAWQQRAGRFALSVFWAQLALNLLWSILFFGMRSSLAAFVGIIILWAFIAWTIALFWKVSRLAALLLLPYLLWVSFAALLNYSILLLN